MKKKILFVIMLLALCLSLTACKSSDYKKAIELQGSGDYQAAADIFAQLSDFEDSAERLAECNTMLDYLKAIELQSSADYQAAADIFAQLSDFEDSAEHLAECNAMIDAIKTFDNATAELGKKNTTLDDAIAEANTLVQSEDKALDESLRTSLETLISIAKAAKIAIPEMPATADEINRLAESLLATDYSDVSRELSDGQTALENSIKQYSLVNNPSEAYVITCLKKVPGIMDISAATEDNDPNGNLGKAGGYTAAVYFSHEKVNQSEVYGSTIIEKGTDCGGQIEVYASEEDANKRNDYLAGFDGTIFASGSHTVIGTVLVRTSNELTASQQKELDANIIAAFIALE